ncbi:hypothetical protein O0L34_g4530 [Tuta absoluta]|nr:hypothetical protein O0L34_g4530 [Tuta absoluta]
MAPQIKYTQLFIDNKWVNAVSGKTFDTYYPHDCSVIAKVAEGDKADIDIAVAAAKRAFHRNSEWRLMDATQRRVILNKFAELIRRNSQYLAELESYNNGMLLSFSHILTMSSAATVEYLGSLADKVQGDTCPADGDIFAYTLKQPVGVCGLILPWNGPIPMFVNKICTALAAGCTMVVKPAEQTPLTALALGALLVEAGVPPGVVNIVPGYGETAGHALTHHPDVAKISFTGSREVGKIIQQAAGAVNLKRITLELGGKSPLVIMNDADLDVAVKYAAIGVFTMSGQVCIAASRVYVQSGIYDEFVKRMTAHAKSIKVGNPMDPASQQGPQTDEPTLNKILEYIKIGKSQGAKLMVGGKRIGNKGYYVEPTIFADVRDDMAIAREEIFGPVQSILKFDTLEEVIDRANDTTYGLAAGIITTSIESALQFSRHVEAGSVWVNSYMAVDPRCPFGGFKDSGIGRECGHEALEPFLETKAVVIALPKKL